MVSPDDIRKIAREEAKKSQASNVLNGTIASAAIDGTITWYDISIVALVAICATFLSLFVIIGACLAGIPFRSALNLAGRTILTGVGLAAIRLIVDFINPLQFVADWQEFKEWKLEYYEPPATEHTIKLEIPQENGFRFLHFDADQTKRVIAFAREYLSLCDKEDYPTAEKFYVGSGKIFSRSEMDYANWQAFKAALIENRLAFEQGNRWHLTESGKRAIVRIAEVNPPTLS